MDYFIVVILIIFSGIFSGLTLGFFSLNKDDLQRKMKLGDKDAQKIYSVRKKGNLLLTTLLVGNVAVNSALAIFLGSIASGFMAGLIATSLIVVFGEIAPQATFSRYAIILGARFVWVVKVFIFIFLPICWPLSWMLDKILGDEMPTVYSKQELVKIIEEHEDFKESSLDADEERIIKGALSFSDKKAEDIMTPRVTMFALRYDRALNSKAIAEISNTGHSRIPVYQKDKDEIVGMLYVKDLIKKEWHNKKAGDLARSDVIFVDADKRLDDLLNDFKKTRHHLFVVLNKYGGVSGIVTIEDVIEEIIGEEIVDEFDKHADLQRVAKDKMSKRKIKKV